MDLFSIITLLGGLAFFLYGMNIMSAGLEKTAGGALEKILFKMTSNKFMALGLGAFVTMVIQSSSALTVMLVGLVNSGIMEFSKSINVLMGSNIGTTITAWILSLAGIDGNVWYIKIFKPINIAAIVAFIGILMQMVGKTDRKKSIGSILIGFAMLMYGMSLMSGAMEPLGESPTFKSILTAFTNPILAVAVGALFTAVIQSSSASVGILQALSLTSPITYRIAIPIIMGQNIGTCISAVIASVGVSKNAKKVAIVHMAFNIIGTLVILVPLLIVNYFITIPLLESRIDPFSIAVCHSIFNVVTTAVLLPFTKQLEKIANKLIPTTEQDQIGPKLDERLITIPSVAVASALDATTQMSKYACDALWLSTKLLAKYDQPTADKIKAYEETVDVFEDRLGSYMVKLANADLNASDSKQISMMLHIINDYERISDHACNIVQVAEEIHDKKIVFSSEADAEIENLTAALNEILLITNVAFETADIAEAAKVEPLEQVIDELISNIKRNHINRLQSGDCTIQHGFVLNDLLTNYERVSDHCSNIAVAVIETSHGSFDTHKYLQKVKTDTDGEFYNSYKKFESKYIIK